MANTITLIGRITKELEIKPAGSTTKCDFTLAVNRRFAKEGQQQADFINVVCFGKIADNLVKFQGKGSQIAVVGTLNIDQYEKEGEKKSFTKVVANEIEFLSSKGQENANKGSFEPVVNMESDDIPF